MTIRARLDNGEYATLIGPDPNGGHVIRLNNGDMHTVDHITPEFDIIQTPMWITSIYQGPTDGIASWRDLDEAKSYQAAQLRNYNRILPIGQVITHNGLVILTDSTGQPLKGSG